jgi:hypothetical protein
VGFVEGETGYCSDTSVMDGVSGSEEGSITVDEAVDVKEEDIIKVEETIDIKEEIPEPIKFPPIKKEIEVRLQVGWEIVGHLLPYKENSEITVNYFLLCVILEVPYSFLTLDFSHDKRCSGSNRH